MSRKARTRAAAVAVLALIAGGALTYGHLSGTLAIFGADNENQNSTFVGDYVLAAAGFNAPVASGNGQYFTWTVGHNTVNQEVWFADQGTTANCTGATYSNSIYTGGSALGSGVTSIDGANSGTSSDVPAANQGDYICYQIRETNGPWSGPVGNVGTAVQVGLVPTTVVDSGAGTGNLASNDTITITYNHTVSYSNGNINVTATVGNPGTLTLPGIGSFTGGNFTKGGTCTGSTVGGTGTATLTITLKACPNGANKIAVTAGGSGKYTATGANVTSTIGPAGHAYSVNQCSTANPCKPSMTY